MADIAWSDIKGELGLEVDGFDVKAGSQVDWFGTGRGRIGFLPTERLLLYATGGFAYGDVEHSINASYGGRDIFDASTSDVQWGWAAGGGFEYAINDRLSLFTEYLFVDLGSQNLYDDCLFDCGGSEPHHFDNLKLDAETQFHTIKAGINILLN